MLLKTFLSVCVYFKRGNIWKEYACYISFTRTFVPEIFHMLPIVFINGVIKVSDVHWRTEPIDR